VIAMVIFILAAPLIVGALAAAWTARAQRTGRAYRCERGWRFTR
jgi:hypothetical protein